MTPNTNHPRRHLRNLRRPLALAVALALVPFASSVLAQAVQGQLPRVGAVASGTASISYNPGQTDLVPLTQATTITQTSKGAIINWGSFSIGAQNTVTFDHQVAGGVTLNRVVGFAGAPTASNIVGALNAPHGSVFLINPSGIVFGTNAQVNVGGLVASTLNITDADFNTGVGNGHFVFNAAQSGTIDNAGAITANANGTVALLGTRVQNEGTIDAPQGTIALGAGSQITLDIGGDGLTQLTIIVGANDPNGVTATNTKPGTLTADGGQVVMQAVNLGANSFAEVVNTGLVQARSLQSRGGRIVLSSNSDSGLDAVGMSGQLDVGGTAAGVAGGNIDISGYDVAIDHDSYVPPLGIAAIPTPSIINTSGAGGGGTISVTARDVVQIDPLSNFTADATVNGNGGSITLDGTNGLYGLGSFSAQGGPNGGNGGRIDTSGGGVDLDGIRINASALHGTAGTWTVDPYDVSLAHGNAAGTLPTNPFDPLANSIIQDGDINNALNGGTSVTIGTGTTGSTSNGSITIDGGVAILRNTGTVPLTLRFDANTNIFGNGPFTIQSTAGPLNLVFDSNAGNGNSNNGDISLTAANLLTNGGSIAMFGQNDPVNGYAQSFITGISLQQSTLDTRIAGSDANAGGAISLRGLAGYYGGGTGVSLIQTNLHSSSGTINIFGVGTGGGSGVYLAAGIPGAPSQITTTSGRLAITGIGSSSGFQYGSLAGVSIVNYALQSTTGTIDLRGYGAANGNNGSTAVSNDGLVLDSLSTVGSGSGSILLSGASAGSGAGVSLVDTQGDGTPLAPATIDSGSGNLVVRAHNDGTTDALVLNGTLTSTGTIDLRPGGVDANGTLTENPNDAIALGGTTGFALGATEIGNIAAHDLVLGSNTQAGVITVSAPITYAHNLTLDGGAGSSIAVNGALDLGANTLALVSTGNITQTAPVTAKSLLAQSSGGAVMLGNAGNNVSSTTLAGSAAGDFTFVNAATVGIGNVSAVGFNASANAPVALNGSGILGANVLVQALTGNMILDADVGGTNVDLVSAGIFDNAGGNAITASGTWRVWGNTWTGETRAGITGNGNLPNLYGCTFGAACSSGITVPASNNHFIYTLRPTLIVDIANASREYGLPNNAFGDTLNGLILGDQAANAVNGTIASAATQTSNVGSYALNGSFLSPAGYVVDVTPGTLAITPATLMYVANPDSRKVGLPNGVFGGSVTGFRNDDTLASATTGTPTFQSPADVNSPIGRYAIDGSGLSATNYVFTQASGNAVALTILPPLGTYTLDVVRDTPVTYVYDRNFGIVGLCPATDLAADSRDKDGDTLAREWSRVRSRPNLANCVSTKQKNSCGDF